MNPGDTVSRYRILGRIGQGGMGVVYRAEDTRLNRLVALKFLTSESFSEQDRQRFLNEARAAAAIGHPNICPVFDVEETDGRIFIAMAYLDGATLTKKLASGPLEIRDIARIGAQIAAGLEAAHRLGIVHRDIKGSNIVVGGDGHVSILDFGLALRSGATRLTVAGGAIGTPSYMSPEQAMGKAVDFRSDIWSLGVVLFEMTAGVLPFRRDHQAAVIYAIVHDAAPAVAALRPAAPPELRRVIEIALRKEPGERWASAREMAEELRRLAGDSGSMQVAADLDATRTLMAGGVLPVAAQPRKRAIWAGVAAVTLLALGAGGIQLYRTTHPRQNVGRSENIAQERQVAVLPFQIADGDAGARAVADGMVEMLTGALSDYALFHGKVTAVPASEIRSRAINSAEEARRIYGVNLVVSGSARLAGDRVEFTLNLIDALKLRQIDSKTVIYDQARPAEAKRQVVEQLARMLNFELTPLERQAVTAGDSNAPVAYRAYVEGRGLLARYDLTGNIDKAIEGFRRAIAEDPNYALAYAGLAEGLWRKLLETHNKAVGAEAVKNAERAVGLDANLAIAQTILGQIYGTVGRQQEAIAHLRKAIELAPGNAEAPRQLAQILAQTGRLKEAEESYIQATKSRPTDWYGFLLLGIFYTEHERFADSEKVLRKAQELAPNNEVVLRNLGGLYARQGRYAESEKELQQAARAKNSATTYAALATVLYFQHRYEEAVSSMEVAIEMDASKPLFWGNLGAFYSRAKGHETKARPALEKAIELAVKALEATPDDHNARANLAEYRARLGDAKGAMAELAKIPAVALRPSATRIILVYELTGRRGDAIRAVRDFVTTPEGLRQVQDIPDLAQLWADKALQAAIRSRPR